MYYGRFFYAVNSLLYSGIMSIPDTSFHIRPVTAESFDADRDSGHLVLDDAHAEGLLGDLEAGKRGFFVAETPEGEPLGQVGVSWQGAEIPLVRKVVGDRVGLAFLEVPEAHRGKGIGATLVGWVIWRGGPR